MRSWEAGTALAVGATLTALAACGVTTFSAGSTDGGGSDAGHKPDAQADGGKPADAHPPVDAVTLDAGVRSCPGQPDPAKAPTAGSSCPAADGLLDCEYGTASEFTCDEVFECTTSRTWVLAQPAGSCPPSTTMQCPADWDAASPIPTPCKEVGDICMYAEKDCKCLAVPGSQTPSVLGCNVPFPDDPASCPIPRPRLGSSCATIAPGTNCNYGACTPGGIEMHCDELSHLWAKAAAAVAPMAPACPVDGGLMVGTGGV
jgi:hypothetical protein